MRKRSVALSVLVAACLLAAALALVGPSGEPHAGPVDRASEPALGASPPVLAPRPGPVDAPAGTGWGEEPPSSASPTARADDPGAQRPVGAVRVRVHSGGTPIEGAVVQVGWDRLGDQTLRVSAGGPEVLVARTDAAGLATFSASAVAELEVVSMAPPEPALRFVARAAGFRIGTTTDDAPRGEETADDPGLEIELEKGVPFDGRVVDAVTSAPIVGASVVVNDWGRAFEVGPTDVLGAFHVPGVMDDAQTSVIAVAPGRVAGRSTVRIDGGKPPAKEVVVRLEVGGAIVGTVRAPDGTPVPGASVWIAPQPEPAEEAVLLPSEEAEPTPHRDPAARYEYDDEILTGFGGQDEGRLTAVAGVDGAFRIDGVPPGIAYEATAAAGGFAASLPVRDLRVDAGGATSPMTLTLRRSATVLVQVVAPAGARAPNARVRLFLQPGDLLRRPAEPAEDGRYRFTDIEPGRARAFAQAKGFRSAVADVLVTEGATVETVLTLEAGGAVEGVVVDADGNPLAHAEVSVASAARNAGRRQGYLYGDTDGKTDEEGHFSIGGLEPGPAFLVAEWTEWSHYVAGRRLGTRGWISVASPAQGLRIVLSPRGAARMRVLSPDGRPFSGNAWVYDISVDQGHSGGHGGRIEEGRVQSVGLEDGRYALLVVPDAYAWVRRDFTIRDGADVDFGDVRLEPGQTVSGRVVDGGGRPVPDASLVCRENDHRSVRSDAEGRFAFDRFPRAPVTFEVGADGFCSGRLEVDPAKTTGLEVRLGRAAKVRGIVRGPGAQPRPGLLELRSPDAKQKRGTALGPDGKSEDYEYYEGSEVLTVDAEGRFEGEVAPGPRIGWWRDPSGAESRVGEWTFADGEVRDLEIALPVK